MLKFWRKRKNIAVHLVFWPIIGVFIIWGFERYGSPIGSAAAMVNDHTITISQYRNAIARMVDFYNQIFQGNFDEKMQEQYRIKETALNQLIDSELVAEQAKKMGLVASDSEVRDSVLSEKAFQKDGKFSRENYENALRYNHLTPADFEADERRQQSIQKVSALFEKNLRPSTLEIEKEKLLRQAKTDIEFLKLDTAALEQKVAAGKEAVDHFLADKANVKKVKDYFDHHASEFSKGEEVDVRHILVKADKKDPKSFDAALEKIKKIKSELTSANFAELAKKYSDDPGSKGQGGDLGWVPHGRMVPPFDQAAFSLKPKTISEPVRSDFGYHLIEVVDKHPAQDLSLEQAQAKIAAKLLAQEKIAQALDQADAKLKSGSPEEAFKILTGLDKSVKWEETGFFSAADDAVPKLQGSPELINAAFSVNDKKAVYPQLIKDGSTAYALRFKKSQAVADPKATPEGLTQQLADQTGRNAFTTWRESLRSKAKIIVNPQLQAENGGAESDQPGDM